jgi:small subunit ribosomal protein S9
LNEQQKYYYGTGKRKTSVARVRLYSDSGPIVVNGKPLEEAFPWFAWQESIGLPLEVTNSRNQFRVVYR